MAVNSTTITSRPLLGWTARWRPCPRVAAAAAPTWTRPPTVASARATTRRRRRAGSASTAAASTCPRPRVRPRFSVMASRGDVALCTTATPTTTTSWSLRRAKCCSC
uniref:(northern house mosquito) hypothetical protein n=1 Tax=Culex pipiens TaxID=7175 RepID=A0A8D8J3Z4_CULPI